MTKTQLSEHKLLQLIKTFDVFQYRTVDLKSGNNRLHREQHI